ncbi:MAG: hypothetical protein COA38_03495 [Fluviicola sp.]|nr:MAG: hypothetical protein COA38_03495 [Fluviicola sp.]
MEIGLLIITILLIGFVILATIDGFYLHLFKYQLHAQADSRLEHITHTIRAFLFPAIVYTLFMKFENETFLWIGISLLIVDLIVLGIDAYSEKDSRAFMGGLPRWEYILHLFSNSFHFAAIAVLFAVRIQLTPQGIEILEISALENFEIFEFVVNNLLPGSILLAVLHLALMIQPVSEKWNNLRTRITCC